MSFFKLKCKKGKKNSFRRKLRVLWVTEDDRKDNYNVASNSLNLSSKNFSKSIKKIYFFDSK